MFREFFALRDELLAKGVDFGEALGLLAYKDLHRAAIADAGKAIIPQELVVAEQRRRLEAADLMSLQELEDQGLVTDYQAYARLQKLEALPAWEDLKLLRARMEEDGAFPAAGAFPGAGASGAGAGGARDDA